MTTATTFPTMTMAEMEREFDQEWVLIIDPVIDPTTGDIGHGEVAGHSRAKPEMEALARQLAPNRSAVWFIGTWHWDGTYLL